MSGGLTFRIGRSSLDGGPLEEALESWRDLRELLRLYDAGDQTPSSALESWGLVDAEGRLAVPVVREAPGDEIFELAQTVTEKVTAAMRGMDLEQLGETIGARGREHGRRGCIARRAPRPSSRGFGA